MATNLTNISKVSWTSPSGKVFQLKTLTNEYSRKHIGEVKENPKPKQNKGSNVSSKKIQDSNDTFTDLGLGGREISLETYFVGNNHYDKANEFIIALGETGKSKLKLAYGDEITVNVLSFNVKNDLVNNVNSTIISISFHETSPTVYPKGNKSKTNEIKNKASEAKTNIATNLQNAVNKMSSNTRIANFSENFSKMLTNVSSILDTASNASLNSIMSDIVSQTPANNIFTIANQLGLVLYKAGSAANNIKNEIENISSIPSNIFGQFTNLITNFINSTSNFVTDLTQENIDNLLIIDSAASMALVSLSESLLEQNFETRQEAVDAAKFLKELENQWTEHIEDEINRIENLEDYIVRDNSLNDIVDFASSEILERSYELKTVKRIVLSEDKTCIELAYENYLDDFKENPDSTIDYLIRTNGFSDDDFFLVKRGAEVKIYV